MGTCLSKIDKTWFETSTQNLSYLWWCSYGEQFGHNLVNQLSRNRDWCIHVRHPFVMQYGIGQTESCPLLLEASAHFNEEEWPFFLQDECQLFVSGKFTDCILAKRKCPQNYDQFRRGKRIHDFLLGIITTLEIAQKDFNPQLLQCNCQRYRSLATLI